MDQGILEEYHEEDGSRIRLGVTADVTDWKEREHRQTLTDNWLRLPLTGAVSAVEPRFETRAYLWNDNMFTLLGYRAGEIEPSHRHGTIAFIPPISRE